MNSDLDSLLEQLKREPLPGSGKSFDAGVWQHIAQRKRITAIPWWTKWQNPRIAAIAAVAALAMGIGTTWLTSAALSPSNQAMLGLDVFSANAPHLPATLLAHVK